MQPITITADMAYAICNYIASKPFQHYLPIGLVGHYQELFLFG